MNRKALLTSLVLLAALFEIRGQDVYTLDSVIDRAKSKSLSFKRTETIRENSYWVYRSYRTNYNPQIRMSSNGGSLYTNSIFPVRQPDGSISYLPVNQWN